MKELIETMALKGCQIATGGDFLNNTHKLKWIAIMKAALLISIPNTNLTIGDAVRKAEMRRKGEKMLELSQDRSIAGVEEINIALMQAIAEKINGLDDNEYIDILRGRSSITVRLCDPNCICGNIENIPCQWLETDRHCRGRYCRNRITHHEARIITSANGQGVKL